MSEPEQDDPLNKVSLKGTTVMNTCHGNSLRLAMVPQVTLISLDRLPQIPNLSNKDIF